jgi:hypothetical protein
MIGRPASLNSFELGAVINDGADRHGEPNGRDRTKVRIRIVTHFKTSHDDLPLIFFQDQSK